jgi:hypothetical protein
MRELFDLDPFEVSLVDEGANKKKFLIMKSRKGSQMSRTQRQEIRELINSVDAKTMGRVEKVLKSMHPIKKEDGDMEPKKDSAVFKEEMGMACKEDESQPISERAQAALKAVARILAPFKDELHDGHMDAVQHEIGMHDSPEAKAAGPEMGMEGMEKAKAFPQEVKDEHHVEALGMAKAAYKEHLEKMGYRQHPDPDLEGTNGEVNKAKPPMGEEEEDEDEIEKNKEARVSKTAVNKSAVDLSAFPKEQRSQLELIFKANKDLQDQNKELVQKAANMEKALAERDAKDKDREYVAKAATFTHLGIPTEEVVESLRDAAKVGEKSYERVCKQFAQISEQNKTGGLFKEIGSRLPNDGTIDAEMRLNKLVDSVIQKSDSKMTREQIYEQVIQSAEGSKLYSEMKSKRPGGI